MVSAVLPATAAPRPPLSPSRAARRWRDRAENFCGRKAASDPFCIHRVKHARRRRLFTFRATAVQSGGRNKSDAALKTSSDGHAHRVVAGASRLRDRQPTTRPAVSTKCEQCARKGGRNSTLTGSRQERVSWSWARREAPYFRNVSANGTTGIFCFLCPMRSSLITVYKVQLNFIK